MSKDYVISPAGPCRHPWIDKADTKFAAPGSKGMFKLDLVLTGEPAHALRSKIDADVDAAWDEITAEMTPKDIKAYTKSYPYEVEEDDQGRPTGNIIFKFKQNAELTLRSGEKKLVQIGIYDSQNNPIHKPVFGGSQVRVAYTTRAFKFASGKTISVRLDFAMVQVLKLQQGAGGGRSAFGAVDDGYVEEDDGQSQGFPQSGEKSGAQDGDY